MGRKSEEEANVATYTQVNASEFDALCEVIIKHGLSGYFEGHPGVGKTQIVNEVAKRLNANSVTVHPAVLDIGDMITKIPIKDREDNVRLVEIVAEQLPRDKPYCLFIDEIRHGEQSVLFVFYRLILDRALGSMYKMPAGSSIIACSNPTSDIDTPELDGALITRFDIKAELTTSWKDFEQYLLKKSNSMNAMYVIGFLRFCNGKYLMWQNPNVNDRYELNPRVWEKLITLPNIEGVEALKKYSQFVLPTGVAAQFSAFVDKMELYSKDVYQYVEGKEPFPKEIDEQAAIMTSIIAYLEREKDYEKLGDKIFELKMKNVDEEIKSVIIVQTLRVYKRRKNANLRKIVAGKNGPAIMTVLQEYKFLVDDTPVASEQPATQ